MTKTTSYLRSGVWECDRSAIPPEDFLALQYANDQPAGTGEAFAVTAWVTADAVGTNTLAQIDVSVQIHDRGAFRLAYGTVHAEAVATSPIGTLAYATALTEVDITGADLVFSRNETWAGNGSANSVNWWQEMSETSFVALDFTALSGRTVSITQTESGSYAVPWPLPGANLAAFTVDVQIHGTAGYAGLEASAITVADKLSTTTVTAIALVGAHGTTDEFVVAGCWPDVIVTGDGSDFVQAGAGADTIRLGEGDNTAFGNAGDDLVQAGAGDDWLFGGRGNDRLYAGGGRNWIFGGAGNDRITALGGDDAIEPGQGDDVCDAGDGSNTFLLGQWDGDGNDRLSAGSGADWYIIDGSLGSDVIQRFTVAQGDRLVMGAGDWDSDAGLRAINGSSAWLQRGSADPRDLVIVLMQDGDRSTITLDDFFGLNPSYAATPRGVLTDDQALPLLRDIFVDVDTDPAVMQRLEAFRVGGMIDFLS